MVKGKSLVDEMYYDLHPRGLKICLKCELDHCIFDFEYTDTRRKKGCALYPVNPFVKIGVTRDQHEKARVIACNKIKEYIAKKGRINITNASLLTGMHKKTIGNWLDKFLLYIQEGRHKFITGIK